MSADKPGGKPLPELESDAEAERFVAEADLTDYDLSAFNPAAFEFQVKDKQVNMRLPAGLLPRRHGRREPARNRLPAHHARASRARASRARAGPRSRQGVTEPNSRPLLRGGCVCSAPTVLDAGLRWHDGGKANTAGRIRRERAGPFLIRRNAAAFGEIRRVNRRMPGNAERASTEKLGLSRALPHGVLRPYGRAQCRLRVNETDPPYPVRSQSVEPSGRSRSLIPAAASSSRMASAV